MLNGVLRRDDEERLGEQMSLAFYCDLLLFHRFKQRALSTRRSAIDFVGENNVSKYRPGVKNEFAAVTIVDINPGDVRGQQIACELHMLKIEPEEPRKQMREGGLTDARLILNKQVSPREQAGLCQTNLVRSPDHHSPRLRDSVLNLIAGVEGAAGSWVSALKNCHGSGHPLVEQCTRPLRLMFAAASSRSFAAQARPA